MGRKGGYALACGACVFAIGAAAPAGASAPATFPIRRVARVLANSIAHDAARRGAVRQSCCGVRVSRIRDVVKVSRAGTAVSYVLALETRGGAIRAISVSESGTESARTPDGGTRRSSWSFGLAIQHQLTRGDRWEITLSAGDANSIIPADPKAPSQGVGGFKECGGRRTSVSRELYEQVLGVLASAKHARLDSARSFPDSDCALPRRA
jgi:hypothetical protein